jgi:Fungalysin metallopeptidase (M36)/PA domain
MGRLTRLLPLLVVLLLIGPWPAGAQNPDDSPARAAASAGAVASSFAADGVPQFLWATSDVLGPAGAQPGDLARWHLARFARAYRVSANDLAAVEIVDVQTLRTGTITHVRQRIGGVDVHGSDVRVLTRGARLVSISGRPLPLGARGGGFVVAADAALAGALSHRFGTAIPASALTPAAGDPASRAQRFTTAPGSAVTLSEPAAVTPIFYRVGAALVAAYKVEFFAGSSQSADADAFRYVMAADDGRVLEARDLTVNEGTPTTRPEFTYRVFADPTGDLRPFDGPVADYTPHPTGTPDGTVAPYILPSLLSVFGQNRQPSSVADPWLPATATETNGNNADAYVDHRAPDGIASNGPTPDFRADVTGARTFDRIYDTAQAPLASVDQSKAAITNAFFVVNWLHDYWYDSGFNESAGNAQLDNYGRGGVGGDPMRVEVQDNYFGGSRNNANMSTGSDGVRPRMQMYAWSGDQQAFITITPPGTNLAVGTAAFGPTNFDVTAAVVLANDGTAPTSDGCTPLVGFPAGAIALVDRGTCTFVIKAQNAQAAGAAGVIIANNAAGPAPGLGGADPTITIGVLSISLADGTALKTLLASGPVTARLFRLSGVERDSAIDNGIVAHEWGHYLHHRQADCGVQQCRAQSEGWGDFIALHMMSRDGDNLDGTYSASTYAGAGLTPNAAYFGIRRVPYSVDFTKNALTLRHISDGEPLPVGPPTVPGGANSEVHNAGEVWATMLWEGYVALQKARAPGQTFEDVRRRMADYIVAGLQLAPPEATYTEQRDAILAAVIAARPDHDAADPDDRGAGGADALVLAEAFARRGAGTCAISPPRFSLNLVGVTESFDVSANAAIGAVQLTENRRSCDGDGVIDAGETGMLLITVMNAGPLELTDALVSVAASLAGVTFPAGQSVRIARLAPFASQQVSIPIGLAASFSGIGQLELTVTVANDQSCQPTVTQSIRAIVNADDAPASSTVDTVEALSTSWTPTGGGAQQIWSRVEVSPFNHAWLGVDFGAISDTQLMSAPLVVGSNPLIIAFHHRHSFEDVTTAFDGGVIEVSLDAGATWVDISTYVAPGYNGTLSACCQNPLAGRSAFVGRNASWPNRDVVSLNLGTALAGQTIRLRFRIATDAASGDYGWELDNLSVQGITNTPFSALVPETAVCRAQ